MNNSQSTKSEGVRQASFDHAHPVAKRIFARLKYDTKASRAHVRERILPLVGWPINERAKVSLQALRACMDANGEVPSAGKYSAWREAESNPTMWPSKSYITNTFDGWGNAVAWLDGNFKPDLKWSGQGAMSVRFTENEILDAIREWIEEFKIEITPGGWSLQHPTHSMPRSIRSIKLPSEKAFYRWCQDHPSDGKKRPTRPHSVARVFGSWANGVACANKGGGHSDQVRFLIDMSIASVETRRTLVMPLLNRAIKDNRGGMSGRGFDAWLELEAAGLEGEDAWVASTFRSMRLVWTFGTWEQAIAEAIGDEAAATFAIRGRTGTSKESLIEAVRLCAEAIGRPPLNRDFVAWRADELKAEDPTRRLVPGERQPIPSAQSFNRYWPKWHLMLDEVFGGEVA